MIEVDTHERYNLIAFAVRWGGFTQEGMLALSLPDLRRLVELLKKAIDSHGT